MNRIYEDERLVFDLADVCFFEKPPTAGGSWRVYLAGTEELTVSGRYGRDIYEAWKAYIASCEEAA